MQKIKAQFQSRFGSRLTKSGYLCLCAMFIAGLLPVFMFAHTDAYNQVSSRSIQMSSSEPSATNVSYQVNFNTVTNNQTVGSVVIRICSNSPIIGDDCTAPAGFSTNHLTTTISASTGNITGLTVDAASSSSNRLVLTRSAGTVANGPVSITLGNGTNNGFTNPSTLGSFYARILLVSNTTGLMPGSPGDENNATDAGGVALSTANSLRVTAKVQESIIFCVYTDVDCATGGAAVSLGDENGVLASNSTTYTANAKFDVASNAVAGVVVRLKGDVPKTGPFTISPHGATCTADSTSSSLEQFGLRMSTLGSGMFSDAPYNCATGNHGFDNNTTDGTASIFGDAIAHTAGASDIISSEIEFAAKSAITSEAGVYVTDLTLIATATY